MGCDQRMVSLLAVKNLQNRSESLIGFQMSAMVSSDDGQVVYDVEDSLEVTLSKSGIDLHYPLRYLRDFNADPYEIALTKDENLNPYNWLTNPCQDGPSPAAACGAVFAGGEAVPYSQGFCCRCSFVDMINGASDDELSRANLQCKLFAGSNAQSAHCLRWGDLWYSAYYVDGPVQTWFVVEATIRHCRQMENEEQEVCKAETVTLGPGTNHVCVDALWPDNSTTLSAATVACNVELELVGDFAAWEGTPGLTDKYLMLPSACGQYSPACAARLTESPDTWLLLDKGTVTNDGSECNQIGVSYEAFYSQSLRCSMTMQSCLGEQIESFYQQDLATLRDGGNPRHMVGHSMRSLGDFKPADSMAAAGPSSTAAMVFQTNRVQQTVVRVEMNADSVRYVRRVSPGSIVSVEAPPTFEALDGGATIAATIRNDGELRSDFSLTTECSNTDHPLPGRSQTLPAAASATVEVVLRATQVGGATHDCFLTLRDGLGRVTDTAAIQLNSTAVETERGSQGGQLADGAPTASRTDNTTATAPQSCETCQFYQVLCNVRHHCVGVPRWKHRLNAVLSFVLLILFLVAIVRVGLCLRRCLLPCSSGHSERTSRPKMVRRSTPGPLHTSALWGDRPSRRRSTLLVGVGEEARVRINPMRADRGGGRGTGCA